MFESEETKLSEGQLYIADRVAKARMANPQVSDAVVTKIETLLKGGMSEQQFSPKKLSDLAIQLIADMEILSSRQPEADDES